MRFWTMFVYLTSLHRPAEKNSRHSHFVCGSFYDRNNFVLLGEKIFYFHFFFPFCTIITVLNKVPLVFQFGWELRIYLFYLPPYFLVFLLFTLTLMKDEYFCKKRDELRHNLMKIFFAVAFKREWKNMPT